MNIKALVGCLLILLMGCQSKQSKRQTSKDFLMGQDLDYSALTHKTHYEAILNEPQPNTQQQLSMLKSAMAHHEWASLSSITQHDEFQHQPLAHQARIIAALQDKKPRLALSLLNNSPAHLNDSFVLLAKAWIKYLTKDPTLLKTLDSLYDIPAHQQRLSHEQLTHFIWLYLQLSMPPNEPIPDSERIIGWQSLQKIVNQSRSDYYQNIQQIPKAILEWQRQHSHHPAQTLIKSLENPELTHNGTAILLPKKHTFDPIPKAIEEGMLSAQFHNQNPHENLSFHTANLLNENIESLSQTPYTRLIGPLTKAHITEYLQSIPLSKEPILILNYLPNVTHPTLKQFSLSPLFETTQLAQHLSTQGLNNILLISQDHDTYHQFTEHLKSEAQHLQLHIIPVIVTSDQKQTLTTSIAQALEINHSQKRFESLKQQLSTETLNFEPVIRNDIDCIVIAGTTQLTRGIINLLRYHRSGSLPIFTTSHIALDHQLPHDSGIHRIYYFNAPHAQVFKPTLLDMHRSSIAHQPKKSLIPFYDFGIDAYLISQALPIWQILPSYIYHGLSGHIYMDQNGVIQRLLNQYSYQKGQSKQDNNYDYIHERFLITLNNIALSSSKE